jgi:hypothetical protein
MNPIDSSGHVGRTPEWRKSSLSGASGCIWLARVDSVVHVRESEDNSAAVLVIPYQSWSRFLDGAKLGDFDDL